MKPQIIFIALVLVACNDQPYVTLKGKTMGTYYDIQYSSSENYQLQIDSLLNSFIAAASTYDSSSELSAFNRSGFLQYKSSHLFTMLKLAKAFHQETHGAFEPTLMPLIKAHGFTTSKHQELGKNQIDSLLSFVSFDYVNYDNVEMRASKPGVQLDLSAMGEGYAIDMIGEFLQRKNVENYKVEIGAEMKCKGRNPNGNIWFIGIENPFEAGQLLTIIRLENQAVSTSGTSRKFFTDAKGKRRSHLINPKTGFSIENNLLSVTVKHALAVRADAYSTALMVMGLDSARSFIKKANIEALIVYQENSEVLSWHTPDFGI